MKRVNPAWKMIEILEAALPTWTDQQIVETLTGLVFRDAKLNETGQAHVTVLQRELQRRGLPNTNEA